MLFRSEAVAVVAADTLEQARDAAEAIVVDYDVLPAVATMDAALAASSVRVIHGAEVQGLHSLSAYAQVRFAHQGHTRQMTGRLVALAEGPQDRADPLAADRLALVQRAGPDAAERKLADLMHGAAIQGMIEAAHDISEGGLAIAVVEAALRFNVGARIWLDELLERDNLDLTAALFSESQARVIVSVGREDDVKFQSLCEARGVPVLRIGVTDKASGSIEIKDLATFELNEVREGWAKTLPALFG